MPSPAAAESSCFRPRNAKYAATTGFEAISAIVAVYRRQGTMHANNLLINDGLVSGLVNARFAADMIVQRKDLHLLFGLLLVRGQVTHTDMQLNTSQNCFHNLML